MTNNQYEDVRVPVYTDLDGRLFDSQDVPVSYTDLGSFGQVPETKPDTPVEWGKVTYFGKELRVLTDRALLEIDLEAFLDAAIQIDVESDQAQAIGAIRGLFRTLIHPQDFKAFWALVREHRQGIVEQVAFGKYLIEAMAGNPTDEPSGSSDGRTPTQERSEADLSLRAQRRLEESGRPDLAAAVVMARSRASVD